VAPVEGEETEDAAARELEVVPEDIQSENKELKQDGDQLSDGLVQFCNIGQRNAAVGRLLDRLHLFIRL
jgi:hypothetical protein